MPTFANISTKKIKKAVAIALLFFVWQLSAQGNNEPYSFLRLTNFNGLVNNSISCIFKDSQGFIWFGTSSGLSRFDGSNFKNFTHQDNDPSSLIDNFVGNIQEDGNRRLWLETGQGYVIYDLVKEVFVSFSDFAKQAGIPDYVSKIYIDKNKKLWFWSEGQHHFVTKNEATGKLYDPFRNGDSTSTAGLAPSDFCHDGKDYYYIYPNGVIDCFSGYNYNLMFRDRHLEDELHSSNNGLLLYVDKEADLWVQGSGKGLYFYQTTSKEWSHFKAESAVLKLSNNRIRKIAQDDKGAIWVGTDHGGINVINKYTKQVQVLYHKPEDPRSLSQNTITDILVDDNGVVWLGTYKEGICYYHESLHKFAHYHHLLSDKNSLPFNDVNCFAEDAKGNLWIGTNGGGLIFFDRQQNEYSVYQHKPNDVHSLSGNVVVSLFVDDQGLLWVGTYTGGLNVFDGKRFTSYLAKPNNPQALPSDNIWTITQDKDKRLWIGTLGGGIALFDKAKGGFVAVPNQGKITLPSLFVSRIHKLRNGNLFIGTAEGVLFYDMEEERYRLHPTYNRDSMLLLSNRNVTDVYEDSRAMLWVATREGLTMYDPATDITKLFHKDDGLETSIMNCILEDENQNVWVSKSTGLSQIMVQAQTPGTSYDFAVRNFAEDDGLQGREFNVNARLRTAKGELIFGGPYGFNLFLPQNIKYNTNLPEVVFTDFQIFNKSVKVDERVMGSVVLDRSVILTDHVTIKHDMNVFSIEFAALNIFISDKVKYKYQLEGFDNNWIQADQNIRKVTYTNLNPGKYIFKVMASNNDGVWNTDYAKLNITIMPPFYNSPLAYILYLAVIIGLLAYLRYLMVEKTKAKFAIEQERLQARRHIELDEIKLRFLTNVSHEFRTPLTLILAPLDKLLNGDRDRSERKLLETMQRNANHLLDLVNQLLDLRKLELHGLRFNPSYGDIVSFIRGECSNFMDAFQKKEIVFELESNVESYNCQFDQKKFQRVMVNLMSNALKFTPENGKVWVNLQVAQRQGNDSVIEIRVSDTGIGILPEEREKIFERFYQSKNTDALSVSGSGIGLNLTREMVQLHNGTIYVESELGKGSTFVVSMPAKQNPDFEAEQAPMPPALVAEAVEPDGEPEHEKVGNEGDNKQPVVLLVEDNVEFRSFMKETLEENYTVFEAPDGQKGLKLVHEKHPDLVISDVMMPNMDGLELCKRIKGDLRTSHIPIILLTARTADEDKIKGLEIGADDYITKPFQMDLLLLRIQNLTEKRKQAQKQFQKRIEVNPSEIEISSMDEKLIAKAIGLVEKNISEPGFSVEDLSNELGISRVYLYKKLVAITGKSPIEFIRILRLKRGQQLLEKSQMTISEVAYEVGFNNPRYFSKYFKEEFGMLPSKYIESLNKEK